MKKIVLVTLFNMLIVSLSQGQAVLKYPHCNCEEKITYSTTEPKRPDGPYEWICNEVVVESGHFKNGLKDGAWISKSKRGVIIGQIEYTDGKLNGAVSTALAIYFKDEPVELLSSFFKPEFVSDKLFTEVFNGSTDVLHKLELANSLDALLLARQTVRYSTNRSLENVITANMRLEVTVLQVAGTVQSKTWTFTANGAGFKPGDARSLAEERLIKQIGSDTKMSLN